MATSQPDTRRDLPDPHARLLWAPDLVAEVLTPEAAAAIREMSDREAAAGKRPSNGSTQGPHVWYHAGATLYGSVEDALGRLTREVVNDDLTGLPRYAPGLELSLAVVEYCRANDMTVSAAYVDLDHVGRVARESRGGPKAQRLVSLYAQSLQDVMAMPLVRKLFDGDPGAPPVLYNVPSPSNAFPTFSPRELEAMLGEADVPSGPPPVLLAVYENGDEFGIIAPCNPALLEALLQQVDILYSWRAAQYPEYREGRQTSSWGAIEIPPESETSDTAVVGEWLNAAEFVMYDNRARRFAASDAAAVGQLTDAELEMYRRPSRPAAENGVHPLLLPVGHQQAAVLRANPSAPPQQAGEAPHGDNARAPFSANPSAEGLRSPPTTVGPRYDTAGWWPGELPPPMAVDAVEQARWLIGAAATTSHEYLLEVARRLDTLTNQTLTSDLAPPTVVPDAELCVPPHETRPVDLLTMVIGRQAASVVGRARVPAATRVRRLLERREHDDLTGFLRFPHGFRRLRDTIADSVPRGETVSVAFVKPRGLGDINSEAGHLVARRFVHLYATVMATELERMVPGRYFVLCPDGDGGSAVVVAVGIDDSALGDMLQKVRLQFIREAERQPDLAHVVHWLDIGVAEAKLNPGGAGAAADLEEGVGSADVTVAPDGDGVSTARDEGDAVRRAAFTAIRDARSYMVLDRVHAVPPDGLPQHQHVAPHVALPSPPPALAQNGFPTAITDINEPYGDGPVPLIAKPVTGRPSQTRAAADVAAQRSRSISRVIRLGFAVLASIAFVVYRAIDATPSMLPWSISSAHGLATGLGDWVGGRYVEGPLNRWMDRHRIRGGLRGGLARALDAVFTWLDVGAVRGRRWLVGKAVTRRVSESARWHRASQRTPRAAGVWRGFCVLLGGYIALRVFPDLAPYYKSFEFVAGTVFINLLSDVVLTPLKYAGLTVKEAVLDPAWNGLRGASRSRPGVAAVNATLAAPTWQPAAMQHAVASPSPHVADVATQPLGPQQKPPPSHFGDPTNLITSGAARVTPTRPPGQPNQPATPGQPRRAPQGRSKHGSKRGPDSHGMSV